MKEKNRPIFENKSLVIWKMAIASAVSWEIAVVTGSHHPYLAPLTVVLCLKPLLDQTIFFVFHRFIGTIIGIFIVLLAAPSLHVSGVNLGILILCGGFVAKWLKLDMAAIEQVVLTILLVFVLEQKSHNYAFDRIKDTLIGAVVAIIVNIYLFPFTFVKRANTAFNKYSSELSSMFSKYSLWILGGCDSVKGNEYETQLQKVVQELQQMKKDVKRTAKTFGYFPFCRKKQTTLKEIYQKTEYIIKGYKYLQNVTVTFKDWGSSSKMTETDKGVWSSQMKQFSKDTDNLKKEQSVLVRNDLLPSVQQEQLVQQYHLTLVQQTNQFLEKENP